jgi:hypothetical protein
MNWLLTAQELDSSLYYLPLAVDHHFASFDPHFALVPVTSRQTQVAQSGGK